ncbi:MAG: nicotinamide riboside transporter PnuC [Neisseriaceae bacterium]
MFISDWLQSLFSQYRGVPNYQIFLESLAFFMSLASVFYSKKQNVLAFPMGIIATAIYVYLLALHGIWGNMLNNLYFTIVSCYGWYWWLQKGADNQAILKVSHASYYEWVAAVVIFIASIIMLILIYLYSSSSPSSTRSLSFYLDILSTPLSFIAMWFLARKLIENWVLWWLSDSLAVPMYIKNQLYLTALQFFILALLCISAYYEWKKDLSSEKKGQAEVLAR